MLATVLGAPAYERIEWILQLAPPKYTLQDELFVLTWVDVKCKEVARNECIGRLHLDP